MTPDQYNFAGDATTVLGFIGIVSALVIVVTSFRRFFNSPYNVRYVNQDVSPSNSSGSDSADRT